MDIYGQIRKNNRLTWLIMAVFIGLLLLIGVGFDYFFGATGTSQVPFYTLLALGIGVFSSIGGYLYGDQMVLSSTHARAPCLEDPKEKQWQNVVEEMSIASGIPLPKTYVIDDADPNAFATGRDPQHSSITATRGLLDILNREELQAVAAHEMSHIKNYDVRLMLIVAVLVGSIALLADWASRSLLWGRHRSNRESENKNSAAILVLVVWLIAVILAPILSQIIAMCVSRKREYLADASGAELTRNPAALADALRKIDSRPEPTRSINRGTAHLCIADPSGKLLGDKEGWLADLFSTHPPIAKRIAALQQMSYS